MDYLKEAEWIFTSGWLLSIVALMIACFGLICWVWRLKKRVRRCYTVQRDLQYLSEHDLLSGLKNRNAFMNYMQICGNDALLVMVCDIDGLKLINDHLGHYAGDRLICRAAAILRNAAPPQAQIFRMGGDEFLLLVPLAFLDGGAMALEEKVLQQVQAHNMSYADLPLSLSMGIVSMHDGRQQSLQEAIKEADVYMYEKKTTGHAFVLAWMKKKLCEEAKTEERLCWREGESFDDGRR
ncbi:MAG: GGDEF domain-containing protein [Selenomonadaceae bacterium]